MQNIKHRVVVDAINELLEPYDLTAADVKGLEVGPDVVLADMMDGKTRAFEPGSGAIGRFAEAVLRGTTHRGEDVTRLKFKAHEVVEVTSALNMYATVEENNND